MSNNSLYSDKMFLFSYDFQGSSYSLEIPAQSKAEAQFRLSQMASATLDGEVKMKIGGTTGRLSHWLAKIGL